MKRKIFILLMTMVMAASAAAIRIPSAAVDRDIFFVAVDATDLTTRETSLTSFTVYYSLDDAGTATAMTTPTTTEPSAANMPGVYALSIDESGMTTLTAGHDSEELVLHITHASMAPVTRSIEIYRPDTTEGQTLTVDSNGRNDVGSWLGTTVATPTTAGVPEVDMTHINGGATSGNNATLKLKQLHISNSTGDALYAASTGSNGNGIYAVGNGIGAGIKGASPDGAGMYLSSTNEAAFETTAGTYGMLLTSDLSAIYFDNDTDYCMQDADNGTDFFSSGAITNASMAANTIGTDEFRTVLIDAIVDAIWDELTAGHVTASTFGEQLGTDVDAILADTDELQADDTPAAIAALNDPTAAAIVTALEADTGKLDHLWEMTEDDGGIRRYTINSLENAPTGGGGSGDDYLLLESTTIATLASQTSFTLTSASANDDAYNKATIIIKDAVTDTQKCFTTVQDYTGATKTITLKADPLSGFVMAVGDAVYLYANDGTADDIDLILADTDELQTDDIPTTLSGLNDLSAADVATELATYDGPTQPEMVAAHATTDALVSGLNDPSSAAIADAVWDETATGHTDAGKAGAQVWTDLDLVLGDTAEMQTNQSDWATATGFATAASLSTHDGKLDDAQTDLDLVLADTAELQTDDIPTTLSGLNDLSAADVATELATYDSPTQTEMAAAHSTTDGLINGLNDPSAAAVADAVWDETATGHTDAGKAGAQVWTDLDLVLGDTDDLQTSQGDWATATGFATAASLSTHDGKLDVAQTDLDTITGTGGVLIGTDAMDRSGTLDVNGKTLGTGAVDDIWNALLTGGTYNINQSAGKRIREIQENLGYEGGAVWIDTVNGTAGTDNFTHGTVGIPSSNITDAKAIADSLGLKRFVVIQGSTITLNATFDSYSFTGDHWALALNGQDVKGTAFVGAEVTGTGTSSDGDPHFDDCGMGAVNLPPCHLHRCGITGTITIGAGDYIVDQCYSKIAGTGAPSFDFQAGELNTNLSIRHYSGGVEIQNMGGAGTDTMSLEGGGQLVINANCSGGTVAVRGNFTVTDNASGAVTLSDDARIDVGQIDDTISANTVVLDIPTTSEFEDRTLPVADYFDPDDDAVANVTSVATTTENTDMVGTTGANTTVPDAAGTAAGLHATTDGLIGGLNDISAADVIAALKTSTGWTAGGVYDFQTIAKILTAWAAGNWQEKSGSPGTQEILDPDDGTTVIAEVTMSASSPYKTVVIP